MSRRWNALLWIGFLVVLSAPVAFLLIFLWIPSTRDFPWPMLLTFGAGLTLMAIGLRRAYREPQVYRGKIAGSILAVLAVVLFGFVSAGIFYFPRQLPRSEGSPRIGQKAPDFTLPDQDGNLVTLSKLLESGQSGEGGINGLVLIFYRGFW